MAFIRIVTSIFINNSPRVKYLKHKNVNMLLYSTGSVAKCVDIFDIFIDCTLRRKLDKWHKSTADDAGKNEVDDIELLLEKMYNRIETVGLADSDNAYNDLISKTMRNKHFANASQILDFCSNHKIPIPIETVRSIGRDFANNSYNDGLNKLKKLCQLTHPEEYVKQGRFLYHYSKAAWLKGNTNECLSYIKELNSEFPELSEKTKCFMRIIIEDSVATGSKAQLVILLTFIKAFCSIENDFYMMAELWNCLFQSELFTDKQLADELLNTYKEISVYVQMMCIPLAKHFLKTNKDEHLSRLIQVLLRFEMKEQYTTIVRDMFDFYCIRANTNRCAEIVKSCAILNIPLREDQYQKYISLSVCGHPYQLTKPKPVKEYTLKF